ncbi:MAG: hypothetical protein N2117_12860 [Anaerolineales bacterium]|nr:hypothetical protein [Anaerolineales bacterium]
MIAKTRFYLTNFPAFAGGEILIIQRPFPSARKAREFQRENKIHREYDAVRGDIISRYVEEKGYPLRVVSLERIL